MHFQVKKNFEKQSLAQSKIDTSNLASFMAQAPLFEKHVISFLLPLLFILLSQTLKSRGKQKSTPKISCMF